MVFFTCNACGQSIKKNKVEKHYQVECRNCEILSCMDCGKEFAGDEYLSHTSCISEAEKYQGALYLESNKGQVPKGEKKQQEWLERIRKSVSSAAANPRIANLLERIADYPNIPRKKPKFVNFVRNSLNVRDERTLDQLWDAFNVGTKPSSDGDSQATHTTGQKVEGKESVAGEQGSQTQTSGVDKEKGKEQKPSKKQKDGPKASEVANGGKHTQISSSKCQTADSCGDQEGHTAQTATVAALSEDGGKGGCDGNFETTAMLKKAKKKRTEKSEQTETTEVRESVGSEDVEGPPKKKSRKSKVTDDCVQKDCTTELPPSTVLPLCKAAKKRNLNGEGVVAIHEGDIRACKKKRKHDSTAAED